jgi:hypothetical protein
MNCLEREVAELEIRGLDHLMKKLESLGQLKFAVAALKAGALHIKGKIAQYPPASEANTPSTGSWYKRSYGQYYGKRLIRKSETLGKKWTIASRDGGLTQVIGNNVSYGPYVQSAKFQAWFHKKRGWKTDEQVIEEEKNFVADSVLAELRKAMKA